MTCDCIANANLQLQSDGHILATLMSRGQHGAHPRVLLRTFDTTSKTVIHPPVVAATHCPFCGTKYED